VPASIKYSLYSILHDEMDAHTMMISQSHRSAMDVNSHGNFVGRPAIYDWHKNLRDDSVCTGVRMYRHRTPLILLESTDDQFDMPSRRKAFCVYSALHSNMNLMYKKEFKRGAEAATGLKTNLLGSTHQLAAF